MIWTLAFWKGAAERAIKTAAQGFIYGTGLSMLVTGLGDGTGIAFVDVPWLLGVQSAVVMAVFSVVTSIGNPSFTAGTDTDKVESVVNVTMDPAAIADIEALSAALEGANRTARTVDLDAPDHT